MDMRELPSLTVLEQALEYDLKAGLFHWKFRDAEGFVGGINAANRWNPVFAGRIASTVSAKTGYSYIGLRTRDGERKLLAHRVAWKMATGADPDGEIDHINGARSDNRFANLREVARAGNSKNLQMPRTNTSGVVGVRWVESRQKWIATIQTGGRSINLGRFTDKADAIAARKAAEAQYGFHANHGRDAA